MRTPGPWKAIGLHIMAPSRNSTMTRIGQGLLMNFNHDYRGRIIPDTEGPANAKLMASAPELLEALEACLDSLGNEFSLPDHCITQIENAIAKATK